MTEQIISQEGYEKLEQELDFLIKKRKDIADRIQSAKDMGDLSENAEYSEAKDAHSFNEGRIAEIQELLKNLIVVNTDSSTFIGLGSKIMVKLNNGDIKNYTIVSFNEVDPTSGKISNESPLGQAFLGRKNGEKITVTTPKGIVDYEIIQIN
jgi:transcription elongation factor GreA